MVIDGKRVPVHHAYTSNDIGIVYLEVLNQIKAARYSDLPSAVKWWVFEVGELAHAIRIRFHLCSDADYPSPFAWLELQFDLDDWHYPWSIAEFCESYIAFSRKYRAGKYRARYEDQLPGNGLRIVLVRPHAQTSLAMWIESANAAAQEIYRLVKLALIAEKREASLLSVFDFPEEHRAVCKQYLIYFGEFLRLIGIKADTEVSDDAHRVMLSVTPADGKAVLVFAKAALNVFLRMPDAKVSQADLANNDRAIHKLAMAIAYLQSTVLGTDSTRLIGSVTQCAIGGKVEEKAEFFGGRLVVKRLEKGPFQLDLPRIIRELKDRFPLLKRLE